MEDKQATLRMRIILLLFVSSAVTMLASILFALDPDGFLVLAERLWLFLDASWFKLTDPTTLPRGTQ